MANNALVFSISPAWVDLIACGQKTFELRRRPPALNGITRMIIYETTPRKQISLVCDIAEILTAETTELWSTVGEHCGITREHFFSYFAGLKVAHAIRLTNVVRLRRPISLDTLRQQTSFVPPQSWCRASEELRAIAMEQIC
ncbi:MAG: ASCH domain-containing protein [Alphaproteobacteria bacterium]|nr:ASCH domain-containing protein [Alphaproteobacteria bacterium]